MDKLFLVIMKAVGVGSVTTETHKSVLVVGQCDDYYGPYKLLVYFVNGCGSNLSDLNIVYDGKVLRRDGQAIDPQEVDTVTVYEVLPDVNIPESLIWEAIENLKPC